MNARKFHRGVLVVLGILLIASVGILFDGGMANPARAATADGEPVDIAGVVVLRIRAAVDGVEPLEQVSRIYQRWTEALSIEQENISPDLVRIEEVDGEPVIHIGATPFVRVDAEHARISRTTQAGLAEVWAANLRRAISRYMEIHDL